MPPVPVNTEKQEEIQSLDKELYDSTRSICDEIKLLSERLALMDEKKSEVSEAVYTRVKTDYVNRLEEIKKSFESKKEEIQKIIRNFQEKKSTEEERLKKHQETLEEAKLRSFLGEYSDKKFKEIESRENAEIKKHENTLNALQNNLGQYEQLLNLPTLQPKEELPPPPSPPEEINFPLEGKYFESEGVSEPKFKIKTKSVETVTAQPLERLKTEKSRHFKNVAEAPKNTPAPLNMGFDDSISAILRTIPLEEDEVPAEKEVPAADSFPSPAKLVCIQGEVEPTEFELGENTSIGRSPSNDVILKEAKVSRQHATIHQSGPQYIVVDLKSSNGVYVNGIKVEEQALQDGDEVSVGSYKFKFHLI